MVLADKRELQATLVGEDPLSDLAVLKIRDVPDAGFAHARFAASDRLQSGEIVLAMGAPWGMAHSLTQGVVNNPERLMISLFQDESDYEQQLDRNQPTARYYAWIQHDAAIAPGNSGGPLVDLNGEIVGINTRGNLFGGDMAFAIPSSIAKVITERLIADGEVPRSYFGFGLRSLKNSGFARGVLISSVQVDSPAQRAGLKPGDRILAIDGHDLNVQQPESVPPVLRDLTERRIGSELRLLLASNNGERAVTLRSVVYPPDLGGNLELRALGLTMTELTPSVARSRLLSRDQGLLVTGVAPGRRAATAHPPLAVGDVIHQIGTQTVAKAEDLERLFADGAFADGEHVLHLERNAEMMVSLVDARRDDRRESTLRDLPKAWIGIQTQPVTATTSGRSVVRKPAATASRGSIRGPAADGGCVRATSSRKWRVKSCRSRATLATNRCNSESAMPCWANHSPLIWCVKASQ
ncbi:MAG: trypsin-like peptidase domain-containing protein [Ahniella sp.]|nr:trypsin-like peptidase domain-containing protein [Ahniella sp.]